MAVSPAAMWCWGMPPKPRAPRAPIGRRQSAVMLDRWVLPPAVEPCLVGTAYSVANLSHGPCSLWESSNSRGYQATGAAPGHSRGTNRCPQELAATHLYAGARTMNGCLDEIGQRFCCARLDIKSRHMIQVEARGEPDQLGCSIAGRIIPAAMWGRVERRTSRDHV